MNSELKEVQNVQYVIEKFKGLALHTDGRDIVEEIHGKRTELLMRRKINDREEPILKTKVEEEQKVTGDEKVRWWLSNLDYYDAPSPSGTICNCEFSQQGIASVYDPTTEFEAYNAAKFIHPSQHDTYQEMEPYGITRRDLIFFDFGELNENMEQRSADEVQSAVRAELNGSFRGDDMKWHGNYELGSTKLHDYSPTANEMHREYFLFYDFSGLDAYFEREEAKLRQEAAAITQHVEISMRSQDRSSNGNVYKEFHRSKIGLNRWYSGDVIKWQPNFGFNCMFTCGEYCQGQLTTSYSEIFGQHGFSGYHHDHMKQLETRSSGIRSEDLRFYDFGAEYYQRQLATSYNEICGQRLIFHNFVECHHNYKRQLETRPSGINIENLRFYDFDRSECFMETSSNLAYCGQYIFNTPKKAIETFE